MTMISQDWVRIGAISDIPLRGARVVKTPAGCLAVFRPSENEVFALDDKCPHKGGPLSQGIVHGTSVTCPLHNLVINLENGQVDGPDEGRVTTYSLRLEDGDILLKVSSLGDGDDR